MVPDRELAERIAAALAPRAEVQEAYLFGSRARGEARPDSDVDVAVWLEPTLVSPSIWGADAEIAADLIRALQTNAVDVVTLNRAPPLLYHRVLRDGVRVLTRDLVATTTREAQARSRWCDWAPVQRRLDALLAQRIRSGAFGR